jgi:hypothetical protein
VHSLRMRSSQYEKDLGWILKEGRSTDLTVANIGMLNRVEEEDCSKDGLDARQGEVRDVRES